MNDNIDRQERFQYWLVEMDDALESFLSRVPMPDRSALDFSLKSLGIFEGYLLSQYDAIPKAPDEIQMVVLDGASRYLGETIRRTFGGCWRLELGDPDNANYGIPVVDISAGGISPLCPLLLVTAALDRQAGDYISSVVQHLRSRVDSGFSDLMAAKRKLGK